MTAPKRPMRKVRVMNIENPGMEISFSATNKDGVDERFDLTSGEIYTLPVEIIKYLNNVSYPIYEWTMDKKTGQFRSKVTGSQNRVSCVPVE